MLFVQSRVSFFATSPLADDQRQATLTHQAAAVGAFHIKIIRLQENCGSTWPVQRTEQIPLLKFGDVPLVQLKSTTGSIRVKHRLVALKLVVLV